MNTDNILLVYFEASDTFCNQRQCHRQKRERRSCETAQLCAEDETYGANRRRKLREIEQLERENRERERERDIKV